MGKTIAVGTGTRGNKYLRQFDGHQSVYDHGQQAHRQYGFPKQEQKKWDDDARESAEHKYCGVQSEGQAV